MKRLRVSSQSIASFLERVCDVLLIPGLPAALVGLSFALTFDAPGMPIDPAAEARRSRLIVTTLVAIPAVGCALLWGYRRHARAESVWGGSLLLWLLTVLYNGALLGYVFSQGSLLSGLPWLFVPLMLWWLTVIVLALLAAALDLRALPYRSR